MELPELDGGVLAGSWPRAGLLGAQLLQGEGAASRHRQAPAPCGSLGCVSGQIPTF